MWPFKTTVAPTKLTELALERLREHENRLTDLELDYKNLLKRLQKLEGAFHGARSSTPVAPDEPLTKAQLRLKLGLVPGKPPPNLR